MLHEAQGTRSTTSLPMNTSAVRFGVTTVPTVGCVEMMSPSWWEEASNTIGRLHFGCFARCLLCRAFPVCSLDHLCRHLFPLPSQGAADWLVRHLEVTPEILCLACKSSGSFKRLFCTRKNNGILKMKKAEKHKTWVGLILNRFSTLSLRDTISLVSSDTYRHHKNDGQSHYVEFCLANAKLRNQAVLPA